MNPFDDLNKAMRDRDTQFTKRELVAMHMMAAQLPDFKDLGEKPGTLLDRLANQSIMAADILLEKLRVVK